MTFKVWYADGSTFAGLDRQDWARAPREGVLAVGSKIGERDGVPLGRFCNGSDHYFWTDQGIDGGQSSDVRGFWVPFDGPPGSEHDAKRGIWTDDATMRRAHAGMIAWME